MKKQIIALVVALLSLLQISVFAVLPSIAQVPVSPPKIAGKAVEVDIGVYVEEIIRINEGENSYEAKGYLDLKWRDARLRFDPGKGVKTRIFLEHGADLMLEKIWWPDMEFVNELKPRERLNQRPLQALRIDRICQVAFPVVFLISLLIAKMLS